MAERRNEVMDMVAQVVSWAKAGGTNRFVRLPMSLIRPRACEPSEPNEDTTKVQILMYVATDVVATYTFEEETLEKVWE